jgi:tyrosyl-DNA phosphodiesterase 2
MMSNPWCPPFERRKPALQPHYRFDGETWKAAPEAAQKGSALKPSKIKLISWNIDALGQGAAIRMKYALDYLETVVASIDKDLPIVFFFQEMLPPDLEQIQAAKWIQERFAITDLSNKYWESMWYGTTTLIDKRLDIQSVFRVHMETKMERDGLFVDVAVKTNGAEGKLRLCNAHLESLIANPPLRPGQVKLAAEYMHKPDVHASVLAGDCNSIQPFDRTLNEENGLKDAFLELGGKEDTDEGYTWGQMADPAMRDRFGCSRMDKIMYCGSVNVDAFEYVGVDVKVGEEHWKTFESWGVTHFVTDHYGLMADLNIVKRQESSNLLSSKG